MPPKSKSAPGVKASFRRPKGGAPPYAAPAAFRRRGEFLVVVESPSKCAAVADYLGASYDVVASRGHIVALESLADVDVERGFAPTFRVPADKRTHVEWLRAAAAQFAPERVLLATDADREGEAIAHHIAAEFGLPAGAANRISFGEITREALAAAVAAPRPIDAALVAAQQARQVLDLVIGFGVSPVLWKYLYRSKSNALSAGRCQTPALRLIYDNFLAGAAAAPELRWAVEGTFFSANLPMALDREFASGEAAAAFLEASRAHAHAASVGPARACERPPPRPLNTADLLQRAGSALRWSPKSTMQVAQQLYQAGLITYMRTESRRYSRAFLAAAEAHVLGACGGDRRYVGALEALASGGGVVGADPHEAIRVTDLAAAGPGKAEPQLAALYALVREATVESCMAAEVFNTHPVEVSAPQGCAYRYAYEERVFAGWRRFARGAIAAGDGEMYPGVLAQVRALAPGAAVAYSVVRARAGERGGHAHYGEAGLVRRLEELGIGRPSTYAMLVETVQERGYARKQDVAGREVVCAEYALRRGAGGVERSEAARVFGAEKGRLVLQPVGELCVEFLSAHFAELFDYGYTGEMEAALDAVAASPGPRGPADFAVCARVHAAIRAQIAAIGKVAKRRYPLTGAVEGCEAYLQFGQFGPTVVRVSAGGETEYLPVAKSVELDVGRLARGEYAVGELAAFDAGLLGERAGVPVFVRVGKYGPYVECGAERRSLAAATDLAALTLAGALAALAGEEAAGEGGAAAAGAEKVLRVLDESCSIRRGRFGHYVFYRAREMAKPRFLSLKKFRGKYFDCPEEEVLAWVRAECAKSEKPGRRSQGAASEPASESRQRVPPYPIAGTKYHILVVGAPLASPKE